MSLMPRREDRDSLRRLSKAYQEGYRAGIREGRAQAVSEVLKLTSALMESLKRKAVEGDL